MAKRHSTEYRRNVVARYDQARASGAPVGKAALLAGGGHGVSVIEHWREVLAASDGVDGPRHETKRRTCLRCRRDFKSTWAGERICSRCKGGHTLDGLPDSWGATATLSVADRG